MIISASRRTDIPAFYSDWFFKRMNQGFLYVRNPMNRKQISKVMLNREVIDCIVFWTKNCEPMAAKLKNISAYTYYFQFTVNPYGNKIEKNVPNLEKSLHSFKTLSDLIGPDRVIWRYDPIFFPQGFTLSDHLHFFRKTAKSLSNHTRKCVISFLDVYKKCKKNMKPIRYRGLKETQMCEIGEKFAAIARDYDIKMETCAEKVDLSKFGFSKGKCIDDRLISKISHKNINAKKDKAQRDACRCVASIDIGAYNSCMHHCLYCYANYNFATVIKNFRQHNSDSPLLYGDLTGDEKITERKQKYSAI